MSLKDDITRVVLKGDGDDYINANHVKVGSTHIPPTNSRNVFAGPYMIVNGLHPVTV